MWVSAARDFASRVVRREERVLRNALPAWPRECHECRESLEPDAMLAPKRNQRVRSPP